MRNRQPRVKRSPLGPLDAVVGPENLLPVLKRDTLKRLPAHVTRRERDVPRGMPVLAEDDNGETPRKTVHDRHDLVPVRNGEGDARHDGVLHVAHDECVTSCPWTT